PRTSRRLLPTRMTTTTTTATRTTTRASSRGGEPGAMTGRGITDEDLAELVARVREATGALIRGDVRRYLALVPSAEDYTLMPPPGGERSHGFHPAPEN